MPSAVTPRGQENRPRCSIPLNDADLGLGNANWTKGLQSMSDWIWSGHLDPAAFPNNLARFFLQIPGVFEQQLYFSTTLIFDEPSFRNGVQVSGFIERPVRELVINLIGQLRRSWYTMTHHAILGTLTAKKHGYSEKVFAEKLVLLTEHANHPQIFSAVEREVFKFATAFATNPKSWTDADCAALKLALRADNERRYPIEGKWVTELDLARAALRGAAATGGAGAASAASPNVRAPVTDDLPKELNDRIINAQLVELAFLCLQFVALTDVFSGLNVPDEAFLPDVMTGLLQPEVIARLNELTGLGPNGMLPLTPPAVHLPLDRITAGTLSVEPAPVRGARVPLVSYEIAPEQATRDKGLAVGGVQVGVWGWSFGAYFPGGLVYLLMHHPELARFEAPYSLPLLFNEDEWRNGTQTGGFVSRRIKEIAFLKIYSTTRARYGLEHHTMFLFNLFLDEYGVGRPPNPPLTQAQKDAARAKALEHAERVVLFVDSPDQAPRNTYSDLEFAVMAWVERMVRESHTAYEFEARLRQELEAENRAEIGAGIRRLDSTPGVGEAAAHARLVDHQIAELAMLTGHMDGLGRVMSILRLESEAPVSTNDKYLTSRPGLFEVYQYIGVTAKAQTANELRLNPSLLERLATTPTTILSQVAAQTGEF